MTFFFGLVFGLSLGAIDADTSAPAQGVICNSLLCCVCFSRLCVFGVLLCLFLIPVLHFLCPVIRCRCRWCRARKKALPVWILVMHVLVESCVPQFSFGFTECGSELCGSFLILCRQRNFSFDLCK